MADEPGDLPTLVAHLYETFGDRMYRYALMLTLRHDLAADVVHDVFREVLGGRVPREAPLAYFRRAVRNRAISVARRARVRGEVSLDAALQHVPRRCARPHARARSVRVAVALARYARAHDDALPAALADLVPSVLSAVPADPFGDGPVRYERDGTSFVVYSVGPDGTDEGGDLTTKQTLESLRGVGTLGSDVGLRVRLGVAAASNQAKQGSSASAAQRQRSSEPVPSRR